MSHSSRERESTPVTAADFYNIGWNMVYEVADSEDQASIARKEKLWSSLGFHFQAIRIGHSQ